MNRPLALILASGLCFFAFPTFAQNRTKTIAFILRGEGPFEKGIKFGAEETAAKLKETNKDISLRTEWIYAPDIQQQFTASEELADKKVDAIAIRPLEIIALAPAIERAIEKERIEVVLIDTNEEDARQIRYLAIAGMNDEARGKKVMTELASGLAQKQLNTSVAIFGGEPARKQFALRVEGAKKEADRLKVNVEGVFYGSADDALEVVHNAWLQKQTICGWAMVAGWEVFRHNNTFAWSPQKVFVVAYDDFIDDELAYVREGWLGVLLVDDVRQWGITTVNVIYQKLVNGKEPERRFLEVPPITVTRGNADDFAEKWHRWTR
jgi:LacI family transcriptional regulator